jgi:hypothetical protein
MEWPSLGFGAGKVVLNCAIQSPGWGIGDDVEGEFQAAAGS